MGDRNQGHLIAFFYFGIQPLQNTYLFSVNENESVGSWVIEFGVNEQSLGFNRERISQFLYYFSNGRLLQP